MTIGKLYNANNVVVGQAACLLAPAFTARPPVSTFDINDPFSLAPWGQTSLLLGSATAFTIGYTPQFGALQTTSSLTVAGLTKSQIVAALEALSNIGVGNVFVSGAGTSWTIALSQSVQPGVITATGTGGTVTVTNNLWNPVGATDQGWKFGANKSSTDITIEEQAASVLTTMGSQKITVEGSLSEDIEDTLSVVYNMTQTIVAAISGVPGYTDMSMSDDVFTYALALIMANVGKKPRVLYIPQVVTVSNAETTFRRASAKRMYPAVFTSECATDAIKILNINAAALP